MEPVSINRRQVVWTLPQKVNAGARGRISHQPQRPGVRVHYVVLAGIRRFRVPFAYGEPQGFISTICLQVSVDVVSYKTFDIRSQSDSCDDRVCVQRARMLVSGCYPLP